MLEYIHILFIKKRMAVNLSIDSLSTTTVNMSSNLDTYIIDAAAATTYIYNLPMITSDGQTYTLIRIDGTTGVVNLIGTFNVNGTSFSNFKIFPYSTVYLVSIDGVWNVICSETTSPYSSNVVFSAYFNTNINTPYIGIPVSNAISFFSFFGTTSNYSTISTIVITLGVAAGIDTIINLTNSSGSTTYCSFTIPFGATTMTYNLTAAEKNSLPEFLTPLILSRGSGSPIILNVSSIAIYS